MRHASYRHSNGRRAGADLARRRGKLAGDIRAAVTVSRGLVRAGTDALRNHTQTITNETRTVGTAGRAAAAAQLEDLIDVVYELMDAHQDTVRLAAELAEDLSWQAHLEYLRALQRKGREVLAHLPIQQPDGTHGGTQ